MSLNKLEIYSNLGAFTLFSVSVKIKLFANVVVSVPAVYVWSVVFVYNALMLSL